MKLVSFGPLNQFLLREDSPQLRHYFIKTDTRSGELAPPMETLLETLPFKFVILFLQGYLQFLGLLGMYNPVYVQSMIFPSVRE